MRKFVAFVAAAGMAITPIAASAQQADALSLARAGAPMVDFSFLQDDDDDDDGSTAVILGVVLVVLIGIAAISGNGGDPTSP